MKARVIYTSFPEAGNGYWNRLFISGVSEIPAGKAA